jgi:hypothetical protein
VRTNPGRYGVARQQITLSWLLVVLIVLVMSVAPRARAERLTSDQFSAFTGSPGGFFVCLNGLGPETGDVVPHLNHPECLLGYIVPAGSPGAGELRVIGNGRTATGYPVIDEALLESKSLRISGGSLHLEVAFRHLGRIELSVFSSTPATPGWGDEHCLTSGLNYRVSSAGLAVFVASRVQADVFRSDEHVSEARQYTLVDSAPGCGSFFGSPASAYWRLSRPPGPGDEVPNPPPPPPAVELQPPLGTNASK